MLEESWYVFRPRNFVERVAKISRVHEPVTLLEFRLQPLQGKHVGFEYGYKLEELEFGCSIQCVIDIVLFPENERRALPMITVVDDSR